MSSNVHWLVYVGPNYTFSFQECSVRSMSTNAAYLLVEMVALARTLLVDLSYYFSENKILFSDLDVSVRPILWEGLVSCQGMAVNITSVHQV